MYGIGGFKEPELREVFERRGLPRPRWASVCERRDQTGDTSWALVGMGSEEERKVVLEKMEATNDTPRSPSHRPAGSDELDVGRPMRAFPFDASRANERDLLGYAMMEGLRQDRGRPVTCMALEEKESMQWVIVGCEDTTVRALDGDTGQLLWTYAGFAGLVRSLTVAGAGNDDINLVVCGMGDSSVISLDMDPVHPAAAGQPSLVGRGLRGLRAEREPLRFDQPQTCFLDHTNAVTSIVTSERRVFTGSDDGTVRCVMLEALQEKAVAAEWCFPEEAALSPTRASPTMSSRNMRGAVMFSGPVSAILVAKHQDSGKARFLLCGSRDTTVRSLDAETGKQVWCFPPHLEEFQTTRSSHERARSSGQTHVDLGGHEKPVTALALVLAPDRQERHGLLDQMVGAVDNIATNVVDAVETVVENVEDAVVNVVEEAGDLVGVASPVGGGRGSPTKQRKAEGAKVDMVISGSEDCTVRALDLLSGSELWCTDKALFTNCPVTGLAAVGDGVLALSDDHTVTELDVNTGEALWSCHGRPGPIAALAVVGKGSQQIMATCCEPEVGKLPVIECGRGGHASKRVVFDFSADGRSKVTKKQLLKLQMHGTHHTLAEGGLGAGAADLDEGQIEEFIALLERQVEEDKDRDDHDPLKTTKRGEDKYRINGEKLERDFIEHFGQAYRLLFESSPACLGCKKRHATWKKNEADLEPTLCHFCAGNHSGSVRAAVRDLETWHNTMSWDGSRGKQWVYEAQTGQVNALSILQGIGDNRQGNTRALVMSGSDDGALRALDAETGEQAWVFSGHSKAVLTVATASKANVIEVLAEVAAEERAIGSQDLGWLKENCAAWGETELENPTLAKAALGELGRHGEGNAQQELRAKLLRNLRDTLPPTVVTGSADATVRAVSETGQQLWMFDGHTRAVTALAFGVRKTHNKAKQASEQDPWIVFSGSDDTTVRALDAANGNQLWAFDGHVASVTGLAVDKRCVFSGSKDQTVRALSVADGSQLWVYRHTEVVSALEAGGGYVFVGDVLGSIQLLPSRPRKGKGGVVSVKPKHSIDDVHHSSVRQLKRVQGYLFSASNKLVMTPMWPIDRLGIVTAVDQADAGNPIILGKQVLKPPLQFVGRLLGRIIAAVQVLSFAVTPQTIPELPEEFRAVIKLFGDFALSLGGYTNAFWIAMVVGGAFAAALVLQETVEFNLFLYPAKKRYQLLWMAFDGFVGMASTILFIPVTKTLVRSIDCTKVNGVWVFDAMMHATQSGSASAADSNEIGMICWEGMHWLYAFSGVLMLVFFVTLSVRLKRVYGFLQLIEMRTSKLQIGSTAITWPNLLDLRGDSNERLPPDESMHALSIKSWENAVVEVLCKLVIVASEVTIGRLHPIYTGTSLVLASGTLCAATVISPPYYGFRANRALLALHVAVLWVCVTTLMALLDRRDNSGADPDENSWWVDYPLGYCTLPLMTAVFFAGPYIPGSQLKQVRLENLAKRKADFELAAQWADDEKRPLILNWIDENHDNCLGRAEMDRLLQAVDLEPVSVETFVAMCSEVGADPMVGFSTQQFAELLSQLQVPLDKGNKWNLQLPSNAELDELHSEIVSANLEATLIVHGKELGAVGSEAALQEVMEAVDKGVCIRVTVRRRMAADSADTSWALVTMKDDKQAMQILQAPPKGYEVRQFSLTKANASAGLMKGIATRHLAHSDVKVAESRLAKDETSVRRRSRAEYETIEKQRRAKVAQENASLPKLVQWIDREHEGVVGRADLNQLMNAMHYKPISDEDYRRMCVHVGADPTPGMWFHEGHDRDWVSYSDEVSQMLESAFREGTPSVEFDLDGDRVVVELSDMSKLHQRFVDSAKAATRKKRRFRKKVADVAKVKRGAGFTAAQFRLLQRMQHSEELRWLPKYFEWRPDKQGVDGEILSRDGLSRLLFGSQKAMSDVSFHKFCEAVLFASKETEPELTVEELREKGFTKAHIEHLQQTTNWESHDRLTGNPRMFLPSSEELGSAIVEFQRATQEEQCLDVVLAWIDSDGDGVLSRDELQRLVELDEETEEMTEEGYLWLCEQVGADTHGKGLTSSQFRECMSMYQHLAWLPSSLDLVNALVRRGDVAGDKALGEAATADLEAQQGQVQVDPKKALFDWLDKDHNGRLRRAELDRLILATHERLQDHEYVEMCRIVNAQPKTGFTQSEFERLQHATFTFTHPWLPSCAELAGAIKELHGSSALEPDEETLEHEHHSNTLKDVMADASFWEEFDCPYGYLTKELLQRICQAGGRAIVNDADWMRMCTLVDEGEGFFGFTRLDADGTHPWFYYDTNDDGDYTHEWAPYSAEDCQKIEEAISRVPCPEFVQVNDGAHVVDLRNWAADSKRAVQHKADRSKSYSVKRGVGLTAKQLSTLYRSDPDFCSPEELVHGIAALKTTASGRATWGGEAAAGIEGMSQPSRWNLPAEEAAEDGGAAQSFETEGFSNPTFAAEEPEGQSAQ